MSLYGQENGNYRNVNEERVKELYLRGYSLREIAWEVGVSRTTVTARLLDMNVGIRRRGRALHSKRADVSKDLVLDMRGRGMTWREISREVGVHVETLRKRRVEWKI